MSQQTAYVIRSGILDRKPWTAREILGYYGPLLQEAGLSAYELPTVEELPIAYYQTQEGVFKTLTVEDPLNKPAVFETSITHDTREPIQPNEELVNAGEVFASTYAWVVCGPAGMEGKIREIIRAKHPNAAHVRFIHASPIVAEYSTAAESATGHPNRPPIPKTCLPPEPEPEIEEEEPEPEIEEEEPEPEIEEEEPEPEIEEEEPPAPGPVTWEPSVPAPAPEPQPERAAPRPRPRRPRTDAGADAHGQQPQEVVTVTGPNVVGLVLSALGLGALGYFAEKAKWR